MVPQLEDDPDDLSEDRPNHRDQVQDEVDKTLRGVDDHDCPQSVR
jgi:hypothetical protein